MQNLENSPFSGEEIGMRQEGRGREGTGRVGGKNGEGIMVGKEEREGPDKTP